ncbi:MAG: M50 family metallopeptidase [Candidatus Omnitrophica bacterium]|nr:M50 family metallopeptidase [Candidatus Omnitrophota bacterium]
MSSGYCQLVTCYQVAGEKRYKEAECFLPWEERIQKEMIWKLLKILVGIMLLPVCVGASRAFYNLLISIKGVDQTGLFFLAGAAAYSLFYFSSLKFKFLYVFGHEATHAVLTLLCGGRVKSFRVSRKGGSVSTTKSNVVISLGPYFLPIYTLFFSLAFFLCGIFISATYDYSGAFIFFLGFSIAFHFLMTLDSLRIEQPDLAENGHLFSLTLIYLVNLVILAMLLGLLFNRAGIGTFFTDTAAYIKNITLFIWNTIMQRD